MHLYILSINLIKTSIFKLVSDMLPAWCTSVHWCQVSEFTWTGRWAGLACKVNRFFITIFLDPTEEDVCNELGTQLYRVYREQFVWFQSFVNLQINLIFILNPHCTRTQPAFEGSFDQKWKDWISRTSDWVYEYQTQKISAPPSLIYF